MEICCRKNLPAGFHGACSSSPSHQQCTGLLCLPVSHTRHGRLGPTHSHGMRRYCFMVLICSSLRMSDVEHPFTCLLAISVSAKVSVQVLCQFFNWAVVRVSGILCEGHWSFICSVSCKYLTLSRASYELFSFTAKRF